MIFVASAVLVAHNCLAAPAPLPFTENKADHDSLDINEVGPAAEDWKLYSQLTKLKLYNPSDAENTQKLIKEIEEYSRLVTPAADNVVTDVPDDGATDLPAADATDVTETDSASSDWFATTWRNMNRDDDDDDDGGDGPRMSRQEDGNVEDIIKKISNDLKKLYVKIKQVITVVKNWYALWNVANTVFVAVG